jgi:AcrR family transcriptional regulator
MARRIARTQVINTSLQKGRKSTQRERLLNGMIAAANRGGYSQANVSAVIAEAGVSRPTFYDYFVDKDDCFVAALDDAQGLLLAEIGHAVKEAPPERALQATIDELVAFATSEPARAHFLMSEALAGGPRALTARDQCLVKIERIVERAHRTVPADVSIPDVSPRAVLGGVCRLLASRLRRGDPGLSGLREDLRVWVKSYEVPAGERRWHTLRAVSSQASSRSPQQGLSPPPGALPPGRPGISREEVAENHRQRILYAAAQLSEQKGYDATTVAEITRQAGLDTRAFYALFDDKQDAFMAVHELGVQQTMSATAEAFFAGASWPERVWEALRAFTGLLDSTPTITNVGFVEAHAVGPGAVQRVQDSHVAFSVFFQEGYLQRSGGRPLPRSAVEAIINTIFEIVYGQARARGKRSISGLLGHMGFLSLAPFLGAAEADRFIERQLRARARPSA